MNRIIVKPGQLPLDTDNLKAERFSHTGLGRFVSAVMGQVPVVDGLAVTATSPATMQVKVSAGCLLVLGQVDQIAYGSLDPDTRPLMRLGELEDDTLVSLSPPVTFGYSVNYLIQVTFTEADDTPIVRPYYNAADPTLPLSGPAGSGVTDYTVRRASCIINAKSGSSAATGTQTTPTPDAGYYPLAVVTVAYGAASITSLNISDYGTYPTVPYLLSKLPQVPDKVQSGQWIYAVDAGSANAISIVLVPVPSAPPKLLLVKKVNADNTGAMTISVNGQSYAVKAPGGATLVGGQAKANMALALVFDGGNYQIANAIPPTVAIPTAQQKVGFLARSPSSASIPSNVMTKCTDFAVTESALGDATFSGGRFTVGANTAGMWIFTLTLGTNTPNGNWTNKVSLHKNGTRTPVAYAEASEYGTLTAMDLTVAVVLQLVQGDYLEPFMLQNTGSTQYISPRSAFAGARIGT